MKNAISSLLKSRKFLLGMLDVVVSTVAYFIGKYAGPDVLADVKFLILTLQPIVVIIIGAIAYEDGQLKRGGGGL